MGATGLCRVRSAAVGTGILVSPDDSLERFCMGAEAEGFSAVELENVPDAVLGRAENVPGAECRVIISLSDKGSVWAYAAASCFRSPEFSSWAVRRLAVGCSMKVFAQSASALSLWVLAALLS